MQKAFARQTKLNNVVGRSDYIKNENRQEHLILHSEEHLLNPWEKIAEYENQNQKSNFANNQAREIIIALPHELSKDLEKTKKIIDEYSKSLFGENRDFEYAVHWNKEKTNYHAHIIFSERERINERTEKTYKRDMWYDKETNKMAKANAQGAELRFKKGQAMKDKEGNVRYDSDLFTKKDSWFKTREFNEHIKIELKDTLNNYNFKYRLFDKEIEVAEVHVGHEKKYSKNPELYEKRINHNENVSIINAFLRNYKLKIIEYLHKFKAIFNHNKPEYKYERLQVLLTDPKEQESIRRQVSEQLEEARIEAERILAEEEVDMQHVDSPIYELKHLVNLVFIEEKTLEELDMSHLTKKSLLEALIKDIDMLDERISKLESLKNAFENYEIGLEFDTKLKAIDSNEAKRKFQKENSAEVISFMRAKRDLKFLEREYGIYSVEQLTERRIGVMNDRNESANIFNEAMGKIKEIDKEKNKKKNRTINRGRRI